MRRPLAIGLCLLVSLGAARRGAGQSLDPNGVVEIPRPGGILVESGFSTYRVRSFVGRDGENQDFPGELDFDLGVLRVSYSPLRDFALGIEIPYRWSTYDEPGLDASFRSRGSPAMGGFVDWSPASRPRTYLPAVRIEYLGARSETERVLTISDEVDRFAATLQITSLPGGLPEGWRGIAALRLEYGPSAEDTGVRHFESRLQVQAGPTLARLTWGELQGLAVVGYRASSSARQEGNFFHNRTSQGAFTGLVLSWSLPGGPLHGISVFGLRDVRPRNALSGWRFGLSLRSFL